MRITGITLEEAREKYNLSGRISSKPSYVSLDQNFEIVAEGYSHKDAATKGVLNKKDNLSLWTISASTLVSFLE